MLGCMLQQTDITCGATRGDSKGKEASGYKYHGLKFCSETCTQTATCVKHENSSCNVGVFPLNQPVSGVSSLVNVFVCV